MWENKSQLKDIKLSILCLQNKNAQYILYWNKKYLMYIQFYFNEKCTLSTFTVFVIKIEWKQKYAELD